MGSMSGAHSVFQAVTERSSSIERAEGDGSAASAEHGQRTTCRRSLMVFLRLDECCVKSSFPRAGLTCIASDTIVSRTCFAASQGTSSGQVRMSYRYGSRTSEHIIERLYQICIQGSGYLKMLGICGSEGRGSGYLGSRALGIRGSRVLEF